MTHHNSLPWPLPHTSLITDAQLDFMRTEPKKKASSTRDKEKLGHSGRQYELASCAVPERRFRLFIRQSLSNPQVFSVGLTVLLGDGELVLCRYNSGHHGHKNILEKVKIPATFHQHITTQRYIAAGLQLDGYAVARPDYNSADGALAILLQECSIVGINPPSTQMNLLAE